MTILKVDRVCFAYRRTSILNKISFAVPETSFIGIIGPNGSGKTTLLKLIQRLLVPLRGEIFVGERKLSALSHALIARRIAGVWQRPVVTFGFTAQQFVILSRTPYLNLLKQQTASDEFAVARALQQANCESLKNKSVMELSAGEFQRVCIAAALAQEPQILLLDEPTSFLDPGQTARLSELLDQLSESGMTILCASHDMEFLRRHAQRALGLVAGEQFYFGPSEEILTPDHVAEIFSIDGASRCAVKR